MAAADKRRLIDDNLSWVRVQAGQIHREIDRAVELDELVAYGNQGLVEAAERYDASHGAGAAFKTFAYYRIRGAIYDGLRKIGWLKTSDYARWKAAANEFLASEADRAPPPGAAPSAEADVEAVGRAMDGLAAIFVVSMQGLPEGTQIADDRDDPVDETLAAGQEEGLVRTALARLPERERQILTDHYYGDLTLLDAGKKLGLSKSWASRLHARAVDLLAAELRALEEDPAGATRRHGAR